VAAITLSFVPLPHSDSWLCLIASVVIHVGYFGLLGLAYKGGALSLIYPIMRGSAPAFTALAAAALLSEWPSQGGWVGILLVSAGVLLLAVDSPRSKDVRLTPIFFALLNAGVIVVYSLVDGFGARLSGNAFSYTAWMCMISGILFFFLSVGFFRVRVTHHFVAQWKKGVIGGGCSLVSYSLALWAMTKAPIASVAALRETSIIFGALFAVFFLKERISPIRYVCICMVSIGAIAIKVF